MKTHQLALCPSCGSDSSHDFRLGRDAWLRRCNACDMTFAREYADPSEIYVDGYLTGQTGWGPPDVLEPNFARYLDHVAAQRVTILDRVVQPPGTLLDVGCGKGEFLMGAQRRGWQVTGVEPVAASAAYARDARNLNVKGALLEEAGLPEASFDVVCAMHVLEHLPRVTDFLMTIARWVKPGGHLFVEVPNYRSVQRRNSGAAWVGLRPLEHVAHFTPATLSATLRRAGLEPVVVRTPTYLWPEQGLSFALNDLGQLRWLRWLEPLSVDTGQTKASSQRVKVPIAPVRVLLRAVQSAYDLGKVGMLVVAVARRP